MGSEGGLLLCTWPNGGKPFIDVKMGEIKVENCQITDKKVELDVSIDRLSYL